MCVPVIDRFIVNKLLLCFLGSNIIPSNTYIEAAGVKNWNMKDQRAYGICISLYEQHPVNGKMSGIDNPHLIIS